MSTLLLALARSSRNLAQKKKRVSMAIGFDVIPAYSTVAVVGLDYFIHRLVDGAFNKNYLSFFSPHYDLVLFHE